MNDGLNFNLIEFDGKKIVDCQEAGQFLTSEQAAIDLVGYCGEMGSASILFTSDNVPAAFFNLRNGLAGSILQRFAVYRMQAAMIADPVLASAGRFGEMALEANKGHQFRIFPQPQAALKWLAEG